MSITLNATALAVRIAITKARAALLKASFGSVNRYPAGSSKGGQFAPKGGAGITAPQLGLGGNTWKESGWAGSGMWSKPTAPPPGSKPHPQKDDKGNAVTVNYPTPASPSDTWGNPKAVATFTPNGKAPEVLNGVPFKSWKPPKEGWAAVKGTNEKLDQDFPFEPHPTKHTGAGVIIMEPDGRVWLTKPTNEFGGYKQTFPKGTAESGLTLQQNAIKEAWEETGLKIKIVGIAADIERDTSKARFYFARRVGGTPKDMGWESQALRLAPRKQALELLNRTHDKKLLADVLDELGIRKAKGQPTKEQSTGKPGTWQFQERWPGGSALGGQWKAMGADGITAPPKIAGGLTGSNSVYQKVANALHEAAQAGDFVAADKAMSKYLDANTKFNQGIKSSQHVKWGAQVFEYASAVKGDLKAKASATATADKLQGPQKLSAMTSVGAKPGGSNPGGVYSDLQGKWLVKGSNAGDATDRSKNEVLASKLMQAVGAGAPDMKLVDLEGKHGGGIGVASKWVDGGQAFNVNNAAHMAAAQADFAVHAWLANYDVLGLGMDNTQIVGGKAINIDPGGALLYRAQGAPKGDAFGNKADEWESMRKASINPNGATVYGAMTASQLIASADKLYNINDATIGKLVQTYGPGSDYDKGVLTTKLIERKKDILARVAALQGQAAPTPAPAPASAPVAAPAPAWAATAGKVYESLYTNTEAGHSKFWGFAVHGNKLVTRYGKLYAEGSVTVKEFASNAEALAAAKKLRSEKLAKGYKFWGESEAHNKTMAALGVASAPPFATSPAPAAAPVAPPAPVAAPAPAATRAAPLGSLLNPVFNGVNHEKFDAHAAALKAMTLDQLTSPGLLKSVKGGKMQFSTPAGLLTLNNPPKSMDGKKFINLFNALKDSKQKEAAAAAAASPPSSIPKPTAWPNRGGVMYYKELADLSAEAHAAGNLVKLKSIALTSVGGPAFAGTANGKVMAEYHAKLVADLEKKQATQTMATVQAAQAAVSQPATVPAKGTAPNGAAMPDFAKFKLPASNSNATSHNAKIDKIADLAGKGDVKGLLSLGFGTNNYAKKQVQLTNSALTALGSEHLVLPGQKPSTHFALTGGFTQAQVAAAAATTKQAAPEPHPAVAKPNQAKLDVSKATLPDAPAKFTASGKAWVNDQNNELAAKITMLTQSGNLTALASMTYEEIDKESGQKTGVSKPINEHPSKGITGYYEAAKQTLHDIAHPPRPLKTFDIAQSGSISALTASMPGHKLGTTHSKVAKNEQVGFFMALGKVADPQSLAPANTTSITKADIDAGFQKYKAMSSSAKSFISGVQKNSLPGKYRAGIPEGAAGNNLRALAKAALAASTTKPAGTILYKNIDMSADMLKKLESAGAGTVLQCDSPMCTTYMKDNPNTQHFGKHVIEFVYAPGAKAIDSHGSGAYSGEKEITVLPMARFVLLHTAYEPAYGGQRMRVRVLLLPPEPPGYN